METHETEDLLMPLDEMDEGDPAMDAEPGQDVPVAPFDTQTVCDLVRRCKQESEDARWDRDQMNKVNYDAYHGRQDLSGKVPGQSAEFVPKTSMALEQLAAFIKRGLVSFDNWFSVDLTPDPAITGEPLTSGHIEQLLKHRLTSPSEQEPGTLDFSTTIEDGVKTGALGALIVLKVCGRLVPTRRPRVAIKTVMRPVTDGITGLVSDQPFDEHVLEMEEGEVWRLFIELIRPEDYFPDPTGRGLYEVHRTRRDLHEVIAMAEAGQYDPEAVKALVGSYTDAEVDLEIERETDQNQVIRSDFRKEVEILEFWGTLLDSEGNAVHRNAWCAVANDQFLIRKPADNPYWHQESPFVVAPLLRVPFSVFHKALFDHAVSLNLAMNELFSLMVDGGIGSVWGVRQVKSSRVKNMDDFTNGIPNGATLDVDDDHPDGQPVFMQIPAGQVPQEAMGMYGLLDREFAAATMLSDTARGMTPRKDVSATAVASADQSAGMFFDSIVASLENNLIRRALRLAWLTMLQNADDWNAEDVMGILGPEATAYLARMSPAQRYARYAMGTRLKVSGLSTMLARTREFQKYMAAIQTFSQAPMLAQAFFNKYSPDKMVQSVLKSIMIDPTDLQMTEEEQVTLQQRMATLPQFAMTQSGRMGSGQPGMMQAGANQLPGSATQQVQASIAQQNQLPQGL